MLLFLAFKNVRWEDFIAAFRNCNWGLAALSVLAAVMIPASRALRWHRVVAAFDPTITRAKTFTATFMAYLTNLAIPYSHEVTRCVVIHRSSEDKGSSSYERLIGVAAFERVCDFASIALILAFLLLAAWKSYAQYINDNFARPAARMGWIPVAVVAALTLAVVAGIAVIRRRRHRDRLCGRISDSLDRLAEGFKCIGQVRNKNAFLAETALIWVMYWLQFLTASHAFPGMVDIGPLDCLFLSLLGPIASILPVPGGFGAFHIIIASALSGLYGAEWESGIIFATLIHESQVLVYIVLGGAAFFAKGKSYLSL